MDLVTTIVGRMTERQLRDYATGQSRWGEAARAEIARRRQQGSMAAAMGRASGPELRRIIAVREPGDPIREEARRILDERLAEWVLDGREEKC